MVVSIAVSADGTIWAGHDLQSGSVSRLSPDGSWSWFPTREAAVVANYARILETQNVNRLWTISGKEVWVDLSVYTGTEWIEHDDVYALVATAGSASMPSDRILAADTRGNVYVTDNSAGVSVLGWQLMDLS